MIHVLTVSATVTRLKWRPPANDPLPIQGEGPDIDRHDSMLAVATAPIKGATDGGSGVLALWTYNRPFMPLSVVEGHQVGAVTDFFWLDTPHPDISSAQESRNYRKNVDVIDTGLVRPRIRGLVSHESDAVSDLAGGEDKDTVIKDGLCVWQHVLSVGRDGQCLIQSFARGIFFVCKKRLTVGVLYHSQMYLYQIVGDRPISRVPPSCFALANKSPFSQGFGSLQICSVHQKIPSGAKNDFWLAGLRQDELTIQAPGVFREIPGEEILLEKDSSIAGKRLPGT